MNTSLIIVRHIFYKHNTSCALIIFEIFQAFSKLLVQSLYSTGAQCNATDCYSILFSLYMEQSDNEIEGLFNFKDGLALFQSIAL